MKTNINHIIFKNCLYFTSPPCNIKLILISLHIIVGINRGWYKSKIKQGKLGIVRCIKYIPAKWQDRSLLSKKAVGGHIAPTQYSVLSKSHENPSNYVDVHIFYHLGSKTSDDQCMTFKLGVACVSLSRYPFAQVPWNSWKYVGIVSNIARLNIF